MLQVVICLGALLGLILIEDVSPARADDAKSPLSSWLERPILAPGTGEREVGAYCAARVPKVRAVANVKEWEEYARKLRAETLANTVYRGQAAHWRDAKLGVEFLDEIPGGPGYKIRKLRYEALPGLWIPAVLYLPEKMTDKMPVALNVNGHDKNGKAADYKQLRCINQAKRGIISLNPEWLFMGQLSSQDYAHYRLNQLDLCGTSGLAPFYLSMKRGLDILLALPNADPTRVAVAGLSGGGWQTIFISSLDTRVTLANPVAGYSSLLTRIGVNADLGDSEQQPVDLSLTADYTHLTALLAPRPALLTYNAKDNCCFVAGSALPPLLAAAEPIYKLYGREAFLRTHVNEVPGDHNFGQENREAHYRILGDHFFAGQTFDAHEIPSGDEVKSKDQLHVPLPDNNATLHSLALGAMQSLPREPQLPKQRDELTAWQTRQREALRKIVRHQPLQVEAETIGNDTQGPYSVLFWKLHLSQRWTVPAVEIVPDNATGTTIIVADAGRKTLAADIERLLKAQQRVIAVDPFYLGESTQGRVDFLYGLLVSTVGDRPLGIQAAQLAAIARWQHKVHGDHPVALQSHGPRTSLMALTAAALETELKLEVRLAGALGSLKEIIEQNRAVNEAPDLFCFGLLEQFDIAQLVALAVPNKVTWVDPSERAEKELAPLKAVYQLTGTEHSPVP